jgi:hypothetical protein
MSYNGRTIARNLKFGHKVKISARIDSSDIEWGDAVYVIPLPATVKKGDLVYCQIYSWDYSLRYLRKINDDGTFWVSDQPKTTKSYWYRIDFDRIFGALYEVRKKPVELPPPVEYYD